MQKQGGEIMNCPMCNGGMFGFAPMIIPIEGWGHPKGWACKKDGMLQYEFHRGEVRLIVDPNKKPNNSTFKDWLDNQYARIMEIRS